MSTVGRGDSSNKPRPSLIVQSDDFNTHHPSLTVCPIASGYTGDGLFRVPLQPDDENGLTKECEIEIDLVQAVRRERIRQHIGRVSEETMFLVDQALRRWLAL